MTREVSVDRAMGAVVDLPGGAAVMLGVPPHA